MIASTGARIDSETEKARSLQQDTLRARHKAVPRKEVAQRRGGGLSDADTRGNSDTPGTTTIVADPEACCRSSQIAAVIPGAGDAKGLAQAAGAPSKFGPVYCAAQRNPAGMRHSCHAGKGFRSTTQDAAGFALGFTGHVKAIVMSVNEVDRGVPRRAEDDGIAQGLTTGGVSCGVSLAVVGFDFHDAGYQAWIIISD